MVVAVVVVVAVGSGGHAAAGLQTGDGDRGDRGARVEVVASFYPLSWAARAVGGADVTVTNLTPPGAEPHDLELTTDERDAIEDADVVVVMGRHFQPAIEEAARDRDRATVVVLAEVGIRRRAGARDPHVWLDPVLMSRVVDAVESALAEATPERSRAFARRAERVRDALDVLDAEYRAGLAECDRDLLVTAHEAFGWLAARYDLEQQGAAGIDPEIEPDPRRLGELADLARRAGVTTIFTEELVSPDVAETLAREAGGLRTDVLNPLEGITASMRARGDDYLSVMGRNLVKLRRALGCR